MAGSPTTATIGVNSTIIQKRITGDCVVGSAIRAIDVDGVVTCQTVSSGPWVTNGLNISNSNTGNVGIGTIAPATKLHVNDSLQAETTKIGVGLIATSLGLNLDVTGQSRLYGNVGIWTEPKNEFTLDVNGNVTMTGLTLNTSSKGVGKVLTSDIVENATWQTPYKIYSINRTANGLYILTSPDKLVFSVVASSGGRYFGRWCLDA